MPFTPYHFGPNAFVGLIFRKWLDIPVLVLANVVVDVEVLIVRLFDLGWPIHRYAHTLLLGAVVGATWGIAAYPFRQLFEKVMRILLIPYRTSFWKMVISGVLGVWLHIIFDAVYHCDVQMFWPSKARPLYELLSRQQVKMVCIGSFIAAAVVYALAVISYLKQKRANPDKTQSPI
jgi:membrane-bound metal-dependent hydrolase YbcI (DUF457 family)